MEDIAIATAIKTAVDSRVAESEKLNELRYDMSQTALVAALSANDHRLDSMNEWRATFGDTVRSYMTRHEVEALLNAITARMESINGPVAARLEVLGRPNWALFTSAAGVVVAGVAAIWMIIGLKIDVQSAPMAIALQASKSESAQLAERVHGVEAISAGSVQADALSRGDRTQLNDRVKLLETTQQGLTVDSRTSGASVTGKLVEIETQFHALSDAFNIQIDANQQIQALLYSKAFPGEHLPLTGFRAQYYK